jgi:hypothetical protein
MSFTSNPEVRSLAENPIKLEIPKLIFDDCLLISTNQNRTFTKLIPNEDIAFSSVSIETHHRFFNIFNTYNLHLEFFQSGSGFGILRLLAISNQWSVSDFAYLFGADLIMA